MTCYLNVLDFEHVHTRIESKHSTLTCRCTRLCCLNAPNPYAVKYMEYRSISASARRRELVENNNNRRSEKKKEKKLGKAREDGARRLHAATAVNESMTSNFAHPHVRARRGSVASCRLQSRDSFVPRLPSPPSSRRSHPPRRTTRQVALSASVLTSVAKLTTSWAP